MKRSLSAIIASILIAAVPLSASAQVGIGVAVGFGGPGWGVGIGYSNYAPPALPYYAQPAAPYPNWQWVPGYWGYGYSGYYWVPGYWTAPPAVGLYWTPGYWGYANGAYIWAPGYWGPTVGFYGGVNYGYGYFGTGFVGGYWAGPAFMYNTGVATVDPTVIHNTYVNRTVVHGRLSGSGASFNGPRGVRARATPAQVAARRDAIHETAAQRSHELAAAHDRGQLARVNHGHPRIVAVRKPLSPTHVHSTAVVHNATHGKVSAPAHHNASAATTHHTTTTTHHNTSGAHHTTNVTHHNAPVTTAHHGQTSSGTAHNLRLQSGNSYHHVGYGGSSHGSMHSGRPPSGGYSHGMYGAPRPASGVPHGAASGGRPPGGGGRMGGGRPPHH